MRGPLPALLTDPTINRYADRLLHLQQHPLRTFEVMWLLLNVDKVPLAVVIKDAWLQSQRNIGLAFNSERLGRAFETHVLAAEAVLVAAKEMSDTGLVVTSGVVSTLIDPKRGLLATNEARAALNQLLAKNANPRTAEEQRRKRLLDLVVERLQALFAEGKEMAKIFQNLAPALPLSTIEEHLNVHLFHMLTQAGHLFEAREANIELRDENLTQQEDTQYTREVARHEHEARAWRDRDIEHIVQFARLAASHVPS